MGQSPASASWQSCVEAEPPARRTASGASLEPRLTGGAEPAAPLGLALGEEVPASDDAWMTDPGSVVYRAPHRLGPEIKGVRHAAVDQGCDLRGRLARGLAAPCGVAHRRITRQGAHRRATIHDPLEGRPARPFGNVA